MALRTKKLCVLLLFLLLRRHKKNKISKTLNDNYYTCLVSFAVRPRTLHPHCCTFFPTRLLYNLVSTVYTQIGTYRRRINNAKNCDLHREVGTNSLIYSALCKFVRPAAPRCAGVISSLPCTLYTNLV